MGGEQTILIYICLTVKRIAETYRILLTNVTRKIFFKIKISLENTIKECKYNVKNIWLTEEEEKSNRIIRKQRGRCQT